jgi:DNA-binding XRE family transcriptional regulator
MITGRQAKARREMLGWGRTKMACTAQVAQSTVSILEAKGRLSPRLAVAIQSTLGVEFTNGGRPGGRMRPGAALKSADA